MERTLFTDLIDASGKVGGPLKAIVYLPKPEREAMRSSLDETYRLIGTAPNTGSPGWATSCFTRPITTSCAERAVPQLAR